jgi:hypothetical protein
VTGGYVGQDLSCDSPGIYVFDASELKWQNRYVALVGGNDLNQQSSQEHNATGLSGSYGYRVPEAVQSVIGGNDYGRATLTAPATEPTEGPIATGKPITYTVTGPGSVATQTTTTTSTPNIVPGSRGKKGPNIGAIVAGAIAGILAIVALYLGFCAYVYRRQLVLYKKHMAAVQRASDDRALAAEKKSTLPSPHSSDAMRAYGPSASGPSRNPAVNRGRMSCDFNGDNGQLNGLGLGGKSTANSSTDNLIAGQEPTFLGVMLNPRRSLRVINKG